MPSFRSFGFCLFWFFAGPHTLEGLAYFPDAFVTHNPSHSLKTYRLLWEEIVGVGVRKAPEHQPRPHLYSLPSDTALHEQHWVKQSQRLEDTPHELQFRQINCYKIEGRTYVFIKYSTRIINLG